MSYELCNQCANSRLTQRAARLTLTHLPCVCFDVETTSKTPPSSATEQQVVVEAERSPNDICNEPKRKPLQHDTVAKAESKDAQPGTVVAENATTRPANVVTGKRLASGASPTPSSPPARSPTAAALAQEYIGHDLPTDFRPGRLSPVEVLARIFPLQKREVLELVLDGCNNDILKAIEHFLSLDDSILIRGQNGGKLTQNADAGMRRANVEPARNFPSLFGSLRSAFTPLTPNSIGLFGGSPLLGPRPPAASAPSLASAPYGVGSMGSFGGMPYGREFANAITHGTQYGNPAVHFLFHHPAAANSTFAGMPPVGSCPPGCNQCPPPALLRRADSPAAAFREVRLHDGAVDLSTEASSWRSSPASSGNSKCAE